MAFKPGLEIKPVGGTGGDVGRNMTAVRVDDEVYIFDMGLHMPNYIKFTEDDISELSKHNTELLRKAGAIPDDSAIADWRKHVKGIFIGHAHLDHLGAIPFLANRYPCPIVGTPYSIAVLRQTLTDERMHLKNELRVLNPNGKMKFSKNITLEFISITHSVPQSVLMALHTKYGVFLYGTDFKFDDNPTLGKPSNYASLKRIGDKGVTVALIDILYADKKGRQPSESHAKDLLEETLLGENNKGKGVLVTTFSSHIARLKSIVEFGRKMKRKVVFLGRSLSKYSAAAETVGLVNFKNQGVDIVKYSRKAGRKLKEIANTGRHKYLLVTTGNQGEPKSMLSKIANNQFDFRLHDGDHVIFSSKTIPVEPNLTYRRELDNNLKKKGVKIFTEMHVSGHAAREDLREFLKLVRPKHAIPAHGEPKKVKAFQALWREMGNPAENVHIIKGGQSLKVV